MVVMVHVALNGYHRTVTYQWLRDGQSLREETTPLLYTAVEGTYLCEIKGDNIDCKKRFRVESETGYTIQLTVYILYSYFSLMI